MKNILLRASVTSVTILIFLVLPGIFLYARTPEGDNHPEKGKPSLETEYINPEYAVVPKPVITMEKAGHFVLDGQTKIFIASKDIDLKHVALLFCDQLKEAGGPDLAIKTLGAETNDGRSILFAYSGKQKDVPEEGYRLKINQHQILITGNSPSGLFYGMQTLLQLMPPEILENKPIRRGQKWEIPCCDIRDYPRFPYRGMHLDVSRHFFPVSFIKRYIDLMAMYKLNRFHWHLTDDNGWRIEITKYPKLTETGAWRVDREHLPWRDRPAQKPGEKATYGGFYTQEEIREVVAYAAQRYITIIPEIEMPAHSVEVLAAYPPLSCTGGPFTVPPGSYWPNEDIFCAGNDSVFIFLEDVLTEVMDLFPSEYIHIGGDEATKTRWKNCEKCQKRMQEEGLEDEDALQSYFIRRMEKFINAKGRKLIGWDEILEGGLAPDATVMSWRGIAGGIEAAQLGHDVIMTPTSHCYFDYYQANPAFEPEAIGGFTTLKKVYSFDPIPEELANHEKKHILGAQGNVWTEYIPTPRHAEYMAVPRMLAIAELTWTPRELKNWEGFRYRLETQFKRLDYMGVNYSHGSFAVDIQTSFDEKTGRLLAILTSEQPGYPIHYTLNGDIPTMKSPVYENPIVLQGNAYIQAAIFVDGEIREAPSEKAIIVHHATGKPVAYMIPYSARYPASGSGALTNGIRGETNHQDGTWQGFHGTDVDVIIDLQKEMPVKSISATFLQNAGSWILFPDMVTFSLSTDQKHWHSVYDKHTQVPEQTPGPIIQPFAIAYPEGTKARYVRVQAKAKGMCPEWHPGSKKPCWIFLDEVVVY